MCVCVPVCVSFFVILHKPPESSRTATEECTAYSLTVPTVLTGIWHAG